MEDDEKYIAITHFINPHQFWYACTEDENFIEVCDLEEQLTKRYIHSISGTTRHFTPVVGSVVAVEYMGNKKRFIRARIEEKISKPYTKSSSYIVWAIDHGFPFETTEENIRYLPDEFNKSIDRVRCGGIAKIVPAEEDFDFIQQCKTLEVKNKWNSAACNELERVLVDAASIAFSEQFRSKNGHFWGDLHVVNHHGKLFRVSDYLVNQKIALKNVEKFKELCIKSERTQMPVWQSNDGKTKCSKNKCPKVEGVLDWSTEAINLPTHSEFQNAKLKVAAWSAHNENATNYMGLGSQRSEGSIISSELFDTDLDDSVSKCSGTDEDSTSLCLKKRGIHNKSKKPLPPKPELADFGICEKTVSNLSLLKGYEEKVPENVSEKSSSKTSSVPSTNSRTRYLLEMRRKQLSQKQLESSKEIPTPGTDGPQTSAASKKAEDNATIVSSSTAITDNCMKKMNKISLKTTEEEKSCSSATCSENGAPLGRAHYLNALRLKRIQGNNSEKPNDSSSNIGSVSSGSVIQKTRMQSIEKTFPAGFDLANLNTYRDQNHWHRKCTTRSEQQPKKILNSSDSKNKTQDFRFTRPNNDKNKIDSIDQACQEESKELNMMKSSVASNSAHLNLNCFSKANERDLVLPKNKEPLVEKDNLKTISNNDNCLFNETRRREEKSSFSDSSEKSNDTNYSSAVSCLDESSQDENNQPKPARSTLKQLKKEEAKQINMDHNIISHYTRSVINMKNNRTTKKSQDEQINVVNNDKAIRTKFVEHLMLAHSQIPLHTAEKLEDVFLEPSVFEGMKIFFIDKVYRIQTYAWSHMISGNGLVIVNSAKSGKTWSYIPPLCSSVIFNLQNRVVPSSYGPHAIVLVPSAKHVIEVGDKCARLLKKFDMKEAKTVISYGLQKLIDIKIQLMEICGILVTTPSNLLRLMNDNESKDPLFDPKRIQHIVIDDIDVMLSRTPIDFSTVLKKLYQFVPKVNKSKKIIPQLVVTSCIYQPIIQKLIPILNQPLLLIGDFLEAAVYGKANIIIKLSRKEDKMALVFQFIKKHSILHETLIILCNCESDVLFIVESLMSSGISCIGYHRKSSTLARQEVEEWKKQLSPMKILVCSDDVFPELEIRNAQNLIHYSLAKKWTTFTLRFISLVDIYENLVVKGFNGPPPEKRATSLVLLDEDNNVELPRLIEFLKNHNQIDRVHPDVLALSKCIQMRKEVKRSSENAQLCSTLFEFGECENARCESRHVIIEADVKKDNRSEILQHGDLRLLVLNVFSPTHFSARLLEHRETDLSKWTTVRQSNKAGAFAIKFNSFFYLNPNNLQMHWPIKLNDLVVCKKNDTYTRARVIDASEIKSTNIIQSVFIKLKFIDTGEIVYVKSDEVYVCPEQFRDFPAQATDIRLIGILPLDNERNWDKAATNHVRSLIKENIGENDCVYASIDFALSDTIWVNNVVVMEQLPTIKSSAYKVNLKRYLINRNHGVLDKGVVSKIHDIVKEQGFNHILEKKDFSVSEESPIHSDKTEDFSIKENPRDLENEKKLTKDLSLNTSEISECNSSLPSSNSAPNSESDNDADFSETSQHENSKNKIAPLKSGKLLAHSKKSVDNKSESPLPKVCDFRELIMCIQRSIKLDEEEYNMTGKSMPEGVKEYIRETETMCNAAITYENKKKGNAEIKDIKESNKNVPEIKETSPNMSGDISQLQEPHQNDQNTSSSSSLCPPRLINLHPRPPTVWYETNHLIILHIHAPNIDDYFLEVTSTSLCFKACVNDVQQVLVLNFLGTVEPQLVSHELRGLNVIVRLVKTLYVKWPRLLKQKGKVPWLKYNFNMIIAREMEELLPQQFLGNILHANTSKSSYDDDSVCSDDEEFDFYETFNPITNKEDVHDPIGGELL